MGTSEIWYKDTAIAERASITLRTTTTIPTNTSIDITVYEDVGDDNTGPNSVTDPSGTVHNYENEKTANLNGGTNEETNLTGFDTSGVSSAYIVRVELDGQGTDPTVDSPTVDKIELEV